VPPARPTGSLLPWGSQHLKPLPSWCETVPLLARLRQAIPGTVPERFPSDSRASVRYDVSGYAGLAGRPPSPPPPSPALAPAGPRRSSPARRDRPAPAGQPRRAEAARQAIAETAERERRTVRTCGRSASPAERRRVRAGGTRGRGPDGAAAWSAVTSTRSTCRTVAVGAERSGAAGTRSSSRPTTCSRSRQWRSVRPRRPRRRRASNRRSSSPASAPASSARWSAP